jgi:hypothetical protein
MANRPAACARSLFINPLSQPLPHIQRAQQGLGGPVRQHADMLALGAHCRHAGHDALLEVADGGLEGAAGHQDGRVGVLVEF